jgi:hypothetical protein
MLGGPGLTCVWQGSDPRYCPCHQFVHKELFMSNSEDKGRGDDAAREGMWDREKIGGEGCTRVSDGESEWAPLRMRLQPRRGQSRVP